ncbi:MAG TPA: hypothetical protein VFP61_09720, partial [Acidimicrobiales bacterium]|nr:hypothetical protein [Acidimicrobiales bacterium]
APTFTQTWAVPIADAGGVIATSSPNVAVLDGVPYAVVGDESGQVFALSLASGSEAVGWPVRPGIPIDSTPSVNGSQVFVDAGTNATASSNTGGVFSYNAAGSQLWRANVPSMPSGGASTSAISASAAVGTLQGQTAVVTPALSEEAGEFSTNGASLDGWPWFQGDTNGATPAIADLTGSGQDEIVMGGDSTAGLAFNTQYQNGGHLRVVSPAGHSGSANANAGTVCDHQTNQIVRSSPAVGPFLANRGEGIVAGTGDYSPYAGGSDTDAVIALTANCGLAWEAHLNGDTTDSPALADTAGDGTLNVVEGTRTATNSGSVYVLSGSTGQVLREIDGIPGGVIGGITTVDLGGGHQDLLVPTGNNGVEVFDPATGALLATLAPHTGIQNSPLVTDDPDGRVGITVAGLTTSNGAINGSAVFHFEVGGSNGAVADETGAWPEFHHDPRLTGDAGDASIEVACRPPAGGPQGYWEVSADGGIFSFGNLPFCGSTGGTVLNRPVVGMAGTRDGGGYWTVASDGGIFAFGDAAYHGSTGGIHLNQPIVGMAATPDGGGYWLVASDGGIFAFGDAAYHGSTGGIHLNQPVVAIAPDAATGGYWLVAADGGVFSFGAPYYGSTGGIHLVRPIVAAQATGGGSGYRFEAGDGGVFDFGSATYDGSEGGKPLNSPVVGSASY